MKIYLIRHGRTTSNERRSYCGLTDAHLSENGVRLLEEQREKYKDLAEVKLKYFTTELSRTKETLNLLFANPRESLNYEVLPGFNELNFGSFEDRTYEELKDDPDFIEWISGDFGKNVTPGGESGEQMRLRVVKTFEKLVSELDCDAVVVCHGGTIYNIMDHLFPLPSKTLYEWEPENGCGYVIELDNDTWTYKNLP